MKTVTKFYYWEPLSTRKNFLIMKHLFPFLYLNHLWERTNDDST